MGTHNYSLTILAPKEGGKYTVVAAEGGFGYVRVGNRSVVRLLGKQVAEGLGLTWEDLERCVTFSFDPDAHPDESISRFITQNPHSDPESEVQLRLGMCMAVNMQEQPKT